MFQGFALLHLILATLVLIDQRLNRNFELFWPFVVVFTGPIGFIAYMIFHRDRLETEARKRMRDDGIKEDPEAEKIIEEITEPRHEEEPSIQEK